MKYRLKTLVNKLLSKFDIRFVRASTKLPVIDDDERFNALWKKVRPYTMCSKLRTYEVYKALEYIEKAKLPGDIVECGVWAGGNMLLAALFLKECGSTRTVWLYDTFDGMTEPGVLDTSITDRSFDTFEIWRKNIIDTGNAWCNVPLQMVQKVLAESKYPHVKFVKGKVEDTIPDLMPEKISLLRLDTDWYESTKHELINLYPKLVASGILIIDDYGAWAGSKKACDEYFAKKDVFMPVMDISGRILVKP